MTGHRSAALDSYKREHKEQHVKVSKIVQGITSEKGEAARSSVAIQRATEGLGSIVLNISSGNCNVTIVKKS